MTAGGGLWGLLSWVRSSGRTSSSSSLKFVGTWVEFCRISSIVDGTSSVLGRGCWCPSWLLKTSVVRTYHLFQFLVVTSIGFSIWIVTNEDTLEGVIIYLGVVFALNKYEHMTSNFVHVWVIQFVPMVLLPKVWSPLPKSRWEFLSWGVWLSGKIHPIGKVGNQHKFTWCGPLPWEFDACALLAQCGWMCGCCKVLVSATQF